MTEKTFKTIFPSLLWISFLSEGDQKINEPIKKIVKSIAEDFHDDKHLIENWFFKTSVKDVNELWAEMLMQYPEIETDLENGN